MSAVVSLAERRGAAAPAEPLLAIEDLHVAIGSPGHAAPVIEGMNLEIRRSEIVALVGESGSGKSLTALSATRLLPRAAEITRGRIRFDGADVLAMGPRALDGLRGNRIGRSSSSRRPCSTRPAASATRSPKACACIAACRARRPGRGSSSSSARSASRRPRRGPAISPMPSRAAWRSA